MMLSEMGALRVRGQMAVVEEDHGIEGRFVFVGLFVLAALQWLDVASLFSDQSCSSESAQS